MKGSKISLSGVHVQWPWSQLIVSGEKTVETRSYSIPKKFLGQPLAIIETPGPIGKKNGIVKARIIGIVTFSESFEYKNLSQWQQDRDRHLIPFGHKQFQFIKDKPKFGWVVSKVVKLPSPLNPPKKRGIVFASNCSVELPH